MMKIKASRQIYRRFKYKNDIFDTDNIFKLSNESLNDVGQSSISSTMSTSSLSTSSSRTSSMEIPQYISTDVKTLLIPNEYNVYDKGLLILYSFVKYIFSRINSVNEGSPYIVNEMKDASQTLLIPQDPSIPNLIPLRRSLNEDGGIEFIYLTWIYVADYSYKFDYEIFQNCQIKELKISMNKKSLDLKNALQYLYISNEAKDSDNYNEINICGNNIEIRRKKFKILVVDTSLFICKEISKIIERSGHRCDYETRLEKLCHLHLDEYDLILLDLKNMNLDITALKRNFNTDIKFVGMAFRYYDCNDSLSKEFDITIPKLLSELVEEQEKSGIFTSNIDDDYDDEFKETIESPVGTPRKLARRKSKRYSFNSKDAATAEDLYKVFYNHGIKTGTVDEHSGFLNPMQFSNIWRMITNEKNNLFREMQMFKKFDTTGIGALSSEDFVIGFINLAHEQKNDDLLKRIKSLASEDNLIIDDDVKD